MSAKAHKGGTHHELAAEHHETAAHHHREAAKHYRRPREGGPSRPRGACAWHATHHGHEAAKHHAEQHK